MKSLAILAYVVCAPLAFSQEVNNEIVEVAHQRRLAAYDIHVSTNPYDDVVVVNAPEGAICQVHSISGTYVGTWEVREDGLKLEHLGSGTFIAHIKLGDDTTTRRFIIL